MGLLFPSAVKVVPLGGDARRAEGENQAIAGYAIPQQRTQACRSAIFSFFPLSHKNFYVFIVKTPFPRRNPRQNRGFRGEYGGVNFAAGLPAGRLLASSPIVMGKTAATVPRFRQILPCGLRDFLAVLPEARRVNRVGCQLRITHYELASTAKYSAPPSRWPHRHTCKRSGSPPRRASRSRGVRAREPAAMPFGQAGA